MLNVEMMIENKGTLYSPILVDEVKIEWERFGTPGKILFKVYNDRKIDFQEGNTVAFIVNGKKFFQGYIFTKSRDKKQIIEVIAYDQLRYLKNKDTYIIKDKKASDVIQMIADDYKLTTGSIEDTKFIFKKYIADNKSLWDIIGELIASSQANTGKLYAFYSDFDKITLRDIETMKTNYILTYDLMEDFTYSTTIDGDTYNQIVLLKEDPKTKKRTIVSAEDGSNIQKWGILRNYRKVEEDVNLQSMADTMLKTYNRKERKLEIKNAFGDIEVRGGSLIGAYLPSLGDIHVNSFMMVDRVVHTFSENKHVMDLTLINKDILPSFGGGS